jgi:hypothetical protein
MPCLGLSKRLRVVAHGDAGSANPMQLHGGSGARVLSVLAADRQARDRKFALLLVPLNDLAYTLIDGVPRGVLEDVVVVFPEERRGEAHGPALFVVSCALYVLRIVCRQVGR